ncbi:MAG: peptidoglycan-binding protein [FCB group bacterium]|nr:peptidoglycan-binding protein [FCB group bacterium]
MPQEPEDLKLPDLQAMSGPDRFAAVEKIVAEAEEKRVLADLPTTENEFITTELLESRVRTIRTRLVLLGYLKEDNKKGKVDSELREAIEEFQIEAGLKVDRWVGIKTWTALCELVGFEDDTNLDRWLKGTDMNPALVRAARLRLISLNCLPSNIGKTFEEFSGGFQTFARAANVLRLADERIVATGSNERRLKLMLSTLFNLDDMVDRLGQGEEVVISSGTGQTYKNDLKIAEKFLISLTRIELWLLGYEVKPDSTPYQCPPKGYSGNTGKDYPLYHALVQFWSDAGKSKDQSRKLACSLTGPFFAELKKVHDEADAEPEEISGDEIYSQIAKQEESVLKEVWDIFKSIGSRIWDGIKRVFRWIKALFKKGVEKAVNLARNLARLAYSCATDAFRIIKDIVKMLTHTVKFVVESTFSDSDANHLVFRHDTDFDYSVYVNPSGSPARIAEICNSFHKKIQNV